VTVTYQGIKAEGRTASNDAGVRSYSQTYILTSDAKTDTASDVGNNSQLPSVGSAHATDAMAYCHSLSVNCVSGYTGWEATATWTTENSIEGETGLNEDPEQDRHVITWNGSTQNVSIYKDRDGKGILNSAGDPLLDVMDTNLLGVTVASNVTAVPSWILGYRNSINNAAINVGGLAIAAGVARLVFPGGFISAAKTRGDHTYYTFSYELIFDEQESHEGQLLDQGYNERFTDINTTNGLRPILNDDKTVVTEPALLDGSGARLANPTTATAQYITVNKYSQKDFSVLPGVTAQ
jgi:hypothetical protein